jgi:SAM-dependent methyltransferase
MQTTKKASRNASEELGLMDTFLSLPDSRRWSLSQLAKPVRIMSEAFAKLETWLEPRVTHANERLVEKPFVFRHLPNRGKVVDVGCTSSQLALELACLGYEVTGIDLRVYPFTHRNLTFEQCDVLHSQIPSASQDVAILISVLEHMGLGSYGDARGVDDRAFLASVARLVRADGTVLVTVPFGKASECSWYRVYDASRLLRLIGGYRVKECLFARRISLLGWELCDREALSEVSSERPPMNGVALVALAQPGQLTG